MSKVNNIYAANIATIGKAIRNIANGETSILATLVDMRTGNKGAAFEWGDREHADSLHFATHAMLAGMVNKGELTEASANNYKSRIKGALCELSMPELEGAVILGWQGLRDAIGAHREAQRAANPAQGAKRGRKAAPKAAKASANDDSPKAAPVNAAQFLSDLRAMRAAAPKVTEDRDALDALDEAIAAFALVCKTMKAPV